MSGLVLFEDGPAKGASLTLRRTPIYLRVVKELDGRIDALDQPDDTLNLGDVIFIYKKVPGAAGHVCTRGRGCFHTFTYRLTDEIDPEGMEDWEKWRAAVEALPNEVPA